MDFSSSAHSTEIIFEFAFDKNFHLLLLIQNKAVEKRTLNKPPGY